VTAPAGAKKGGGRSPREAKDTLRSTQIAELVILIGEGEAQGLVNGLKSVYLDGVPVENADGSKNFDDVEFAYNVGTQGQPPLPGLTGVQTEIAVGVQVDQSTPVVRTITDPAIDQVRVTIGVPQLTEQNTKTGDLQGSSVQWAIDIQSNGGGWVEKHAGTINGKTTSRYARAVLLDLAGAPPWDIRVRRVSAEPAGAHIVNRFAWDSYTLIQKVKLRYPHSAVAWLRVNAQHFARVPVVAFDWLGQRVQVPTNYDPLTRVYTGAWNGTFKTAWTNNPAWCTHAVVTQARWGLGGLVDPLLANKWALYAIGQYCDQLVSDGRGGMEPRFTLNANIETREEAYALLRELAAVFRGLIFWSQGAIEFGQDAPGEPDVLYTAANVVNGDFSYADTSHRQLHSVFVVRWQDPSQFGKEVPEVYTDTALVARYGVNEIELTAFACSSRGQAARVARWLAYTEQHEAEVVTFAVGADGVAVQPGRLFKIADPNEAGERMGGRIQAATAGQVTLDAPVTLDAGVSYTLSVLQPDAADAANYLAEKRAVTTPAGTTSVLAVSPGFSAAPAPQTVWLLEGTTLEATQWRCLGVEEVAGKNEFRVTGTRHHPGKFALIEQGLKLDQRPISRLKVVPPRVASVALTETPYLQGNVTRSRVTVSWPEPARGLSYLVGWRLNAGPWTDLPMTTANAVEIDGLVRGLLELSVRAFNAIGNGAPARTASLTLLGKTARPGNVNGFTATVVEGGVLLRWARDTADDYLTHEIRQGASWDAGTVLFEGAQSEWLWPWPALGSYTLWIKSWDTSLGESAAAVSAAVNVTEAIYTQWAQVRGTGKPADNATSDLVLIGRGVSVAGNRAVKPGPNGWDADCYSADSFVGGAFASAVVESPSSAAVMFGLNTDPTGSQSWESLDYAIYCYLGGLLAYESGVNVAGLGTYVDGAVLAVVYDGSRVRYLKNGVVLREVAAAITAPMYFDSAFFGQNNALQAIRFGPMSSNAYEHIGGQGKPLPTLNYDFVQGIDGWAGVASVVDTSTASGGKCAVVDGSAQVAVQSTRPRAIDKGRTYKVRARVTRDAGSGGTLYVGVYCYDVTGSRLDNTAGGQHPYCAAIAAAVPVDSTWYLFEGLITGEQAIPSASPNYNKFWAGTVSAAPMLFTAAGWVGTLYVDFLELIDVTEAVQANAAAAAAQSSANTANAALADIAADNKLVPVEKQHIKREWDVLNTERSGIDAQATAYGITLEKTAYDDAHDALASYLGALLADLTTTSTIVGATFRSNFSTLYVNKQLLMNKIASEAGRRALWSQVEGISVTTGQAAAGAFTRVLSYSNAAGVSYSNAA
jgi:predicted phage tail protein